MAEYSGGRITHSAVGGDSYQIGRVDGDLVLGGPSADPARRAPLPADFWTAPGPGGPAHRRLGLVRVRDADPVRLGVHRPIRVPGHTGPAMPPYVPRDLDAGEPGGLRALVRAGHGFVLLVGGSCAGKTRSLYEAVAAELPDWWLAHPADRAQLTALTAVAADGPPPRHLVIWLDELQHHVGGPDGLTAGAVRTLLAPGCRVLLVATLWPHHHGAWTTPPTAPRPTGHDGAAGQAAEPAGGDRFARERDLLKLAEVITVGPAFSVAERTRAEQAAGGDPRLRIALDSADFGLTQVIAAAPQLVHRWEAADPYARAVLGAAVDAAVLGARGAVPAALLRAAAPGYCGPAERGAARPDWFEQALGYATRPQLGATAPLIPVTEGARMGEPDGYRVADYLVQHTGREPRPVPPQAFWEACAAHLTDLADLRALGSAAVARQRLSAGLPLLRRAADGGSAWAVREAAELYRRTGDTEGYRVMERRLAADTGKDARLNELLLAGWDFEQIFDLAEAGNDYARWHLIEYGNPQLALAVLVEDLDPDDLYAWSRIAQLLQDEDEDERALPILEMLLERSHDEDDDTVVMSLCELLKRTGRIDRLYELVDEGWFCAVCNLAELLDEQGRTKEAVGLLREFAGQGSPDTDWMLAHLLAKRGKGKELRARAAAGDPHAASEAAKLLVGRGRADEAIELLAAQAGTAPFVAHQLAELLAAHGREPELRTRADAGDAQAAEVLARLMLDRGEFHEAIRLDGQGGRPSLAHEVVAALEAAGEVDRAIGYLTERTRAAAGDRYWGSALADLLARHGRADELRELIDRGSQPAADRLHTLLTERGRAEEAAALRRYGLTADGRPEAGR
ncbi:tetratricopeptide repeat protein [Streptomyces sp. NPDC002073]